MCHKLKGHDGFAKNRVEELRESVRRGRSQPTAASLQIACMTCTPGNRMEIQCAGCNVWKGKDMYSKSQRKNKDHCVGPRMQFNLYRQR